MSDAFPVDGETDGRTISAEEVEAVLRDHYGLSGTINSIAGRRHPYFLIDNGHMRYLLKAAPTDDPEQDVEGEHALMRHVARSPDGPRVPEPVAARENGDVVRLSLADKEYRVRLLTFLDGSPPPTEGPFSEEAIAAFGTLSAALTKSLEGFEHPVLDRVPELDLRRAGPLVVELLSTVEDHSARDMIAKAMVTSLRRIQPLGAKLRIQPSHQNLTGLSVVGDIREGDWRPDGLTDFTGIARGWLVAGLATSCAFLLQRNGGDPFAILPAARAYHALYPLTEAELEALWPLVVIRIALTAATAEHRHAADPESYEAAAEAEERRSLLAKVAEASPALMSAAILDACGIAKTMPVIGRLLPEIDPDRIRLVDLGMTSAHFREGNWAEPEIDWKLLAHVAWETGMGSTRYGEFRLSRTKTNTRSRPENFALHIDVCVPAGTVAAAPFSGRLKAAGPRLVLSGAGLTLHAEGLACELAEDTELAPGDAIGTVAGAEGSVGGLRLRLCRDPELVPPLFSTAEQAGIWSIVCPSPSALLGIDIDAPQPEERARLVRGWREYLYDGAGRLLLDFSGAAGLVGHSRRELASAAERQLLLLDAAPEKASHAEEEYRRRMAALLPDELDRAFFTESPAAAAQLVAELKAGRDDLAVADETATGYGRLGHYAWAFEETGLVPDILIAGSPAATGFVGVFTRSEIAAGHLDERTPRSIGAASFAMANAALELLEKEALRENARETGAYLKTFLERFSERFPTVVAVHGNGLDLAIDYDGDAEALGARLRRNGVLVTNEGTGRLPLRPPLCLAPESAYFFIEILEDILSES